MSKSKQGSFSKRMERHFSSCSTEMSEETISDEFELYQSNKRHHEIRSLPLTPRTWSKVVAMLTIVITA